LAAISIAELIVSSFHLHIFSESVDQLGGDEECFWQELEICVHFDEPMHQNLPHSVCDFVLAF
jgi:alpha-acetolactate decarboxylase